MAVVKDRKEFETKYPLYEAVNRCARGKECAHTLDPSEYFFKARQMFDNFLFSLCYYYILMSCVAPENHVHILTMEGFPRNSGGVVVGWAVKGPGNSRGEEG